MRLTLALVVGLLFLRIWDPWPIETLRLKYFDTLFSLKDAKPSDYLAIYDIDEEALKKQGQWPWPRQDLAELNQQLLEQGASAVVYTVLFPEPDRFDGEA